MVMYGVQRSCLPGITVLGVEAVWKIERREEQKNRKEERREKKIKEQALYDRREMLRQLPPIAGQRCLLIY